MNLEIDNEPITSMSLFKKPYSKLKATEKEILKNKQLEYFSKKLQNKKEITNTTQNINKLNEPITSMSLFGKTYNELSEAEKEILKNKQKKN